MSLSVNDYLTSCRLSVRGCCGADELSAVLPWTWVCLDSGVVERHTNALTEHVPLDLFFDASAFIFVEQSIVVVWFRPIEFTWEHSSLTRKFVASFLVYFCSSEAKIRARSWPFSFWFFILKNFKFPTFLL